jgi:CBS domain-containing protein
MTDRRVSGLPVVNADGRMLGVVTEADIIVKAASRPETLGVVGEIFRSPAVDDRHLAARTAGEAMTSSAVDVGPDLSVAEAARLMVEHRVNRLPVVEDGKLVGIISRADVVRAFTRSDADIWEELRKDVLEGALWLDPDELDIEVVGGRVKIAGRVESRTIANLIAAFAWRVPGVVSVDCSKVRWRIDDRSGIREKTGS